MNQKNKVYPAVKVNLVLLIFALLICHTVLLGQPGDKEVLQQSAGKNKESVVKLEIKGLNHKADIVLATNLLNSRNDQLLISDDSAIHIYNVIRDSAQLLSSIVLKNNVLQLICEDIDDDGQREIIAATGKTGYVDSIDIRLFIIKKNGGLWQPVQVYKKVSERPHTTFLGISENNSNGLKEIVLSYFESKYIVETIKLNKDHKGNWIEKVIESKRMAISRDIGILPGNKHPIVVVGRPYGDSVGMLGDAYIQTKSEEKFLPSFRGVKVIKIDDLDTDGKNEIFVSDGWHQDYGKIARARIAMISYTDTGYKYELIEDVKGQYEISQIAVKDINGDGKKEVLTMGNKYFRVYTKQKDGWKVFSDDKILPAYFTLGNINDDDMPDVIFAGKDKIEIYNFKDIEFTSDLGKEVITEKINPASLIGEVAPELIIEKWYNGQFTGIKHLKNKVVVLDFWATWCKPCIKMFPTLRSWQQKYGKDGLVILGLTKIDNAQDFLTIDNFIAKEKFPYPIGVAEEAFNNLSYGVGGIPHMVLIDKEGIVRRFEVGAGDGKDFEDEIKKYLAK